MTGRARILIGTHTYAAAGDSDRRQAAALASLAALSGAEVVNVQFAVSPHAVPGVETLAVLRHDSNTVSNREGPRKPIVSEAFDALAALASARGCQYFCFTNGDIVFTQEAVDWIATGAREAYVFSRQDLDTAGKPIGFELAGADVFAVSTAWWAGHRKRFRPYIAGEGCWDNIYTSVLMCHSNGAIENRRPLVLHEEHPSSPLPSPHFGEYIRMLAAFDAGYFTLWYRYWNALVRLRASAATIEEEYALVREIFVWKPTARERTVQAARNLKARVRYVWRTRARQRPT